MKPGDRVIYLHNYPINLNNDLGTVQELDEDGDPVVLWDDGLRVPVNREEVAPVIDRAPSPDIQKPLHLHFGCAQTPCPDHP